MRILARENQKKMKQDGRQARWRRSLLLNLFRPTCTLTKFVKQFLDDEPHVGRGDDEQLWEIGIALAQLVHTRFIGY